MSALLLQTRVPTAEINVTPLIDVMLALVLIFMLTAPLAMHRLDLPLAGSRDLAEAAAPLTLSVKAGGELWLDGVAVNRAGLAAALTARVAAAREVGGATLQVRPAVDARYDDVTAALAIARRSGIERLQIEGVRAD